MAVFSSIVLYSINVAVATSYDIYNVNNGDGY